VEIMTIKDAILKAWHISGFEFTSNEFLETVKSFKDASPSSIKREMHSLKQEGRISYVVPGKYYKSGKYRKV